MATSLRKPAIGRVAPQTWTTDPEEHRRLLAEGQGGLFARVTALEDINTPITVTTTAFTAAREGTILVDDDAAGAAVTVSLPSVTTRKDPYYIKKLGTTANVTIKPAGSETIDRALTLVLAVQYATARISPSPSGWWVT